MYIALFKISVRSDWQDDRYMQLVERMYKVAMESPGLMNIEQFEAPDGRQLALAYFESEEAIRTFYDHPEHRIIQALGRDQALEDYSVEIVEIKRSYTKSTSSFSPTDEESREAATLAACLKSRDRPEPQ